MYMFYKKVCVPEMFVRTIKLARIAPVFPIVYWTLSLLFFLLESLKLFKVITAAAFALISLLWGALIFDIEMISHPLSQVTHWFEDKF